MQNTGTARLCRRFAPTICCCLLLSRHGCPPALMTFECLKFELFNENDLASPRAIAIGAVGILWGQQMSRIVSKGLTVSSSVRAASAKCFVC
jgi:hypothetical protein